MGIFDGITKGFISGAGEIIDKFHMSPEDKKKFKIEFEKLAREHEIKLKEIESRNNKELTKRLKADMTSDSWLSKNVRPLFLSYTIVVVSAMAFIDSFNKIDFSVSDGWITLFQTLLVTSVSFYFGSRGFEKYSKVKHGKQ